MWRSSFILSPVGSDKEKGGFVNQSDIVFLAVGGRSYSLELHIKKAWTGYDSKLKIGPFHEITHFHGQFLCHALQKTGDRMSFYFLAKFMLRYGFRLSSRMFFWASSLEVSCMTDLARTRLYTG